MELDEILKNVKIIKISSEIGFCYSAFIPLGMYPSDMKLIKIIDGKYFVEFTQYFGIETRNMEKIYTLIIKEYPEAKYGKKAGGKILLGKPAAENINHPKKPIYNVVSKKKKQKGFPIPKKSNNIWNNY